MFSLDVELQPCQIDWIWCGIQSKENGDIPAQGGLRLPAKVAIRAWWDARLITGRYLLTDDRRLFHLDSVRDFTGRREEVAITASELVGFCGEARRQGMAPRECRVFLRHDVPYRNSFEQDVVLRTYAEVALLEAGRVEAEDQLLVEGELYNVMALAKDTDDGVVRGLWLERVE